MGNNNTLETINVEENSKIYSHAKQHNENNLKSKEENVIQKKRRIERIKIDKKGMIEFGSNEKQMWRLILSHLNYSEFDKLSCVCKSFFFILKEDQKFWCLFVEKISNIKVLPPRYETWKQFFIDFLIGWDQKKFNGNYKVDREDQNILIHRNKNGYWQTAHTNNFFFEEVLYPFKLVHLRPRNLTIGVSLGKNKSNGKVPNFGVDEYKFGCYYFKSGGNPYWCTNGNGEEMLGLKNFKENGTIYILVHKESYSNQNKTTATVSFFNKHQSEEVPTYQFSISNIHLEAGEKLFGFMSSANQYTKVKLEKPIYHFDRSIIPSQLNLKNV